MTSTTPSRKKRICLAYFVVVLLSFLVSLTRIDPLLFPGDFISFYSAGTLLSAGRGSELYEVATQAQVQAELLARTGRSMGDAVIKFFYPAAFGWLFVPLTSLSLLSAYVLWSLLGVGFLISGIVLVRRAGPGFLPSVPVLVLAGLSFFPILECFLQGQSSLFFLFLLCVFFALLRGGRDFSGGLVLGTVFLKPQLPLVLFLVFLLQRRWRVVGGCVLSVALLAAVSLLTIGPRHLPDYISSSSQLLEDPGIRVELMPNLRGTVHRLDTWLGLDLSAVARWWISVVLSITCLAAFIPGWVRWKGDLQVGFPLLIAQSVLLGMLLTPHLFAYDLALAVLPFSILLADLAPGRQRRRMLGVILVLHTSAFFLTLQAGTFRLPKPWLEQVLFLGVATAICLTNLRIRSASAEEPLAT